MNANTLKAITRHGLALFEAFPNATEQDPVTLCKKLRRIETAVYKPILDYCNGDCDDKTVNTAVNRAHKRLCDILGFQTCFHINRDPRGYALKIDDEWMRNPANNAGNIQRDWGDYGLIAPDLNS